MERLAPLSLHRPRSLADAVTLLATVAGARPIAGGTDLVPNLRRGIVDGAVLVDVSGIDALNVIEMDAGRVRIGSGVPLARIATEPVLRARFTAIAEAAATVAGPAHRTVATLGGNLCADTRCVFYNQSEWWRKANDYCLKHRGDVCHVAPQGNRCHAAYSGDVAPALLAFDASVEIAGPAGSRTLPLAALYADDGARHLTLAPGEIVQAVVLPEPAPGSRSAYRKARVRASMEFPLAGVAACVAADNRRLAHLRIALTGVASRPFVLEGTDALVGEPVSEPMLTAIGKLVQRQAGAMRTTVTSSNYRRQVAMVVTRRIIDELAHG